MRSDTTDVWIEQGAKIQAIKITLSETPTLLWGRGRDDTKEAVIKPGGSYDLKPGVAHRLRNLSPSRPSDVVVIRIGGSFHGDDHLELSSLPRESLNRVLKESRQWYDPRPGSA